MIEIHVPKFRCKICKGPLEARGEWILCTRCRKATLVTGLITRFRILPGPGVPRDMPCVWHPGRTGGPGYERDENDVDLATMASVLPSLRVDRHRHRRALQFRQSSGRS